VRIRLRPRPDEERVDEVVEVEPGLADERAQPIAAAQPPKPGCGKAHANNLRAPRRASVPKIPPSTRSQTAWRTTWPQGLRSKSAERKNWNACVNGSALDAQPAGGTISDGISPRKTIGRTTSSATSEAERASRASAPRSAPRAPSDPAASISVRNVIVSASAYACTFAESTQVRPRVDA